MTEENCGSKILWAFAKQVEVYVSAPDTTGGSEWTTMGVNSEMKTPVENEPLRYKEKKVYETSFFFEGFLEGALGYVTQRKACYNREKIQGMYQLIFFSLEYVAYNCFVDCRFIFLYSLFFPQRLSAT